MLISEVQVPIKVSVVVPVFNSGEHIASSVDSLLAQTMPADELELIFVDDGSTDDTPALLDRLAEEHAQVKVFHEPPSGWPGRPRNVGLEAAVGEYVQFVDQDDSLGEEALTRLYAMARRNDSDIVIGKMIGINRRVPVHLFRQSWDKATIHDSPIIDSLTPHKMFRREFLLESGLRFPEGRRRLEDHVFVVAAYFAARRISVLSDYACYYHITRGDHENAGLQPIDPRSYLANLCEALDVVDANTEPGPARDRLHRRWLRVEIVRRLRGRMLLGSSEDFRQDFAREARRVVLDRFSTGVDAGLPALERLVAGLLRLGDLATLLQLADWEKDLRVQASLRGAQWRDGALVLDVAAVLVDGAGEPVELADRCGSRVLTPPLPLDALEALPSDSLDVSDSAVSLNLFARHQQSGATQFLPGSFTAEDSLVLTATSTSRLPASAPSDDGAPLIDGVWEIGADWRAFGWTFKPPVTADAPAPGADDAVGGPALLGAEPRLARPHRSARGNVRVELTTASLTVPKILPRIGVDRRRSTTKGLRRTTAVDLALHLVTDRSRHVMLQLAQGGTEHPQLWPAVLEPVHRDNGVVDTCRLSATIATKGLAPGRWKLRLSPGNNVAYGLPITCPATLAKNGSMRLKGVPALNGPARVVVLLAGRVTRKLRALGRHAVAARGGRAS